MSISLIDPVTLNEIGLYNASTVQLQSVASVGATPSSGTKLYSVSGSPSWLNTDGYVRTFSSTVTANRTYTLPDISDTLVTLTATQTLSNKTVTDTGSSIYATGLWYGSHAGTVLFSGSSAPTSGQILTATSGTAATWQAPTSIFLDGSFKVENTTTTTKALVFNLAAQTASTTLTLTSGANTTNSIITFPVTASDTVAVLAATQTLTNKTITDSGSSVYSTRLWYGAHAGTVDLSGSGAPSTGYVLTATSSSAATWQAASSVGVSSINANGGAAQTGAVTLTNGNLVSITNSGANFTVAVSNAYATGSTTFNTGLGVNTTNSGTGNTSLGYAAGTSFSSSVYYCTAIGGYALTTAANDFYSTAVGYGALYWQNGGAGTANNTAVGYSAGNQVTTGKSHTFVGQYSGGTSITTGSFDTCVGSAAAATGNYSYGTAVGAGATFGANYGTVIGYGASAPAVSDLVVGPGGVWTAGGSSGYNTLICPSQSAATGMIYPTMRDTAVNFTSSAASLSVTIPATSANGDFLIVALSLAASKTITAPGGWFVLGSTSASSNFSYYYYIYDNGTLAGTSPSWSWTGVTTGVINVYGYQNVNNSTPFDITSTFNSGSSSLSLSISSISTTVYPSTTLCVVSYSIIGGGFDSNPFGYKVEAYSAGGGGGSGFFMSAYDTQSPVGSTPSANLFFSAQTSWTAALVTLRGTSSSSISNTVSVGCNINSGSNQTVVIGNNASSTASVAVGSNATSSGVGSVVIGPGCTDAGFTGCTVIGTGVAASANNQTAILGVPSINYTYCVPLPLIPATSTTTVTTGGVDFNGAVYFLECAVQAVNLYIDVTTAETGSTLYVYFYQNQNGNADCRTTSPQWPLVAHCAPSGAATGSVVTALTFPSTNPNGIFQAGYLSVLWGGTNSLSAVRCWAAGTIQFFNSLVPANGIVANFTTSIKTSAPASAFSPNSTNATASTSAQALIFALSS